MTTAGLSVGMASGSDVGGVGGVGRADDDGEGDASDGDGEADGGVDADDSFDREELEEAFDRRCPCVCEASMEEERQLR